jgi:hypothetical protein
MKKSRTYVKFLTVNLPLTLTRFAWIVYREASFGIQVVATR